jgi:hypothetical protein
VSTASRQFARLDIQTGELLGALLDSFVLVSRRDEVSHWSVFEHLDHLARADATMLDRVDACFGDQACATGTATWLGRLVLASGAVPRHKAEAAPATRPDPFPPDGQPNPGLLAAQFHVIDQRLAGLAERGDAVMASRMRTESPLYGWLRPAQWLRMMEIHRRHHLGIIADILV